ncbi:MAG TPA: peptidoglycan DD-metalloendopeptidase family protein [Polyangia bacterium]|jgi:murein DD-endopeptidase MepM/ murein hydrolase activator NlpD|nr:peptidoglycan DD-metalloendopeptidase family protein [Polyangia bacterium]
MKKSLGLSAFLVGLVGINVYVFFFSHKTAPREVLNLQSTTKTMESNRREILSADARTAHDQMLAEAPKKKPPEPHHAAMPAPVAEAAVTAVTDEPPPALPKPLAPKSDLAARAYLAARTLAANSPPPHAAFQIPFAPPPEPVAARAGAPHAAFQIPFAPPAEDDADAREDSAEKKLNNADTLGQVLAREGFGPAAGQVIAALAKLCDPRSIRGGQKYIVRLGEDGAPASFEYQSSAVLRYLVEKDEETGSWKGRKLEASVELKTAEAGGVVDSSLYESVQKAGESTALVSLLVEQFAWDVNFYTDTHPGDHWKVVIEKQYLGGQFYKYGRLLAAEYGGKVGTFRSFFWAGKGAPRDKPGKYYDDHGLAISKTMLKTPLRYVRISSKFDRKRFHPILHVEKAHLGIDYAAPQGTPVWASASGRVVEVGLKRGSGNTIVLAHANGLSTRYYHLSRYARGLHVGQQVKQKEVIGFVGMTGLATGPHLHFSVTKNGAFVDPSKLSVSRDAPVPDHAAFMDAIRPRIAALKAIQPGAVAGN